ncbi:hypothetical protein ERO13_D07G091700v2 [Gossypium hirsutum]|uniref:Uncharacterized protein LOC107954032 n=4 Tax=Gossypium TaxID=3633 RepID=A0A1U8P183_GOSHI|nr:uncharacterized protein LOC107954032 [Gossypium hirsutum]XP_016744978.1 uncharacterized protein LOC107954032 [Gossypium hirsutum]TYG60863.1 hypothetical protein ES288_D07G101900v1 [Gossypium darwinii]TYH62172.1 hypothetical protein ES332_D07G101700v1 [Gossypium tomentosum]TYI73001.1 hypothetical protein E1A91_D07G100100v1 [Gossypium mustelinum]KAG4137760.1 hypothetical protein ERO13_D07G091700v2 [Gossypium hirsutum]KAG4137761.1 hypothetical protein ERO13_D07G091700v2 [Gossypium hirsutum]
MICRNSLLITEMLKNVNQWMQKTVSNLLMFIGSNFKSLAMPAQRSKGHPVHHMLSSKEAAQLLSASFQHIPDQKNYHPRDAGDSEFKSHSNNAQITRVSSDKDCFPSQSMNQTVKAVRDKLNKIQSNTEHLQAGLHPRKEE